jgi:hypothetical protein
MKSLSSSDSSVSLIIRDAVDRYSKPAKLRAGKYDRDCHSSNELFPSPFKCFLICWIDRILEQTLIDSPRRGYANELKSAYAKFHIQFGSAHATPPQ